jgi:hypothetical protein
MLVQRSLVCDLFKVLDQVVADKQVQALCLKEADAKNRAARDRPFRTECFYS